MQRICVHGGVLLKVFAAVIHLSLVASDVTVEEGGATPMTLTSSLPTVDELQVLRESELVFTIRGNSFTFGTRYDGRLSYTGSLSSGIVSFNLSSVVTQDAGQYRCANGSADAILPSCGEMLRVIGRPGRATVNLQQRQVVVGRKLDLRCDASSTSKPSGGISSYVWFRNGSDQNKSGRVFTIESVSKQDDGAKFQCQAKEGSLLGERSPEVVLDPDFGPETITLTPDTRQYTVGPNNNSLPDIRCTSGPCQPTCLQVWSSRGGAANLNLQNLLPRDSGTYTCNVSNIVGYLTASLSLTVQYAPGPPEFAINGRSSGLARVGEAQSIRFTCGADALPAPTYSVLHEGEEIAPGEGQRSLLTSGTLEISARCEMTGMYNCRAANVYGQNRSTGLHLIVDCKPRPAQGQVTGNQVKVGDGVELLVRLVAYPQPNVTWYRFSKSQGQEEIEGHQEYSLGSTTTTVLNLAEVKDADLGHYRVEAVNEHGSDSVDIFLNEQISDRLGLGIGLGIVVGIVVILLVIFVIVLVQYFRGGRQWPPLLSRDRQDSQSVKFSASTNDNTTQRQESGERGYENVEVEAPSLSRSQSENLYENSTLPVPASPSSNGDAPTSGSGGHYEALQRSTRVPTQEVYEKLKTSDNIYANS